MVRQTSPPSTSPNGKGEGDPRLNDKRYKLLEATMRKHGYAGYALIESLHTAQEAFGFLDDATLMHVARSLHLPPSKVYGVATFYNHFTLKPQGEHTCVVCLGTACYIKGARAAIAAIQAEFQVKAGGTTADGKLSLLTARCFGSCALAPAAVMDGEMFGKLTPEDMVQRIKGALSPATASRGQHEAKSASADSDAEVIVAGGRLPPA
jgi:bidirectional [NiFe] hydrogenase diaphorase subunit